MSERRSSLTVALTVKCEHCSAPVPVNGPAQHVHCRNCQRDSTLEHLHENLALASEGARRWGSPYEIRGASEAKPKCRSCGEVVPIPEQAMATDLPATIPCPKCGTGLPSYPAPAWLRALLPGVRQVFGGDPELAREAGVALELPTEGEPNPIAMACPQCAGSLLITAADARVLECRYCTTSVFLPDDLWRRLHPAKTMCDWTLTYVGPKLQTLADIAEAKREAEAREREAERDRVDANRRRDEAAQAEAERVAAAKASRTENLVILGITLVAAALALVGALL